MNIDYGRKLALPMTVAFCATLVAGVARVEASPAFTAAKTCRKTISVQGRNYAKKRLSLLLNCVDRLLKCEIQLEVDATNPNACRDLAIKSCNARLGAGADTTLSKAQAAFDSKSATACLVFDLPSMLSNGPGGLWYANDAECAGEPDIPSLVDCIRENVEEEVDATVAQVKPRAALLLSNVGLGDEFPNIPLPPTVDVEINSTAPGSGTLVDPGTINVPVGSALRITGNPDLSCGGGASNGRLTITVGTQELTIKEPWGPNEVAIFGPFTATGTIAYSIDFKDQACDDVASGDVDVVP
ncbi:MAG: hypothetical protein AB1689_03915 [Thermodesulfobacteriota bacterium]